MDYFIKIIKGAIPPAKYIYGMSRDQVKVVKKYINNILRKEYIRPSTSLYIVPVLIIKKLDSGL